MADDVILNKAAVIERCVARAKQEYERDARGFQQDFTRQDAAVLNILRVCEAALDLGQHLVRREKLGLPQSARDVFSLIAVGGWIDAELAERLKRMVGYRNIVVHDYQALQLPITIAVIEKHLDDLLELTRRIIRRDALETGPADD